MSITDHHYAFRGDFVCAPFLGKLEISKDYRLGSSTRDLQWLRSVDSSSREPARFYRIFRSSYETNGKCTLDFGNGHT